MGAGHGYTDDQLMRLGIVLATAFDSILEMEKIVGHGMLYESHFDGALIDPSLKGKTCYLRLDLKENGT